METEPSNLPLLTTAADRGWWPIPGTKGRYFLYCAGGGRGAGSDNQMLSLSKQGVSEFRSPPSREKMLSSAA